MPPKLWHAPIDSIDAPALLTALMAVRPHERARNLKGDRVLETLQRIRQRLDCVFEDAIFHKRCHGNPAVAIRRKLREAMPKKDAGEFRALPYRDAPALMARLQNAEGTAARCLEFAVLTAARTAEALLAEWGEFDLKHSTWTVPARRMKGGEQHVVHLTQGAAAIVLAQRGMDPVYVFPSLMRPKSAMSNMAMLTVLDRLGVRDQTTVHGLCRSTFSTWANETGAARPDVIEACLAHEETNRVRAAYNRAEFLVERRQLLQAWEDYLRAPQSVVSLKAA